MIRIYEIYIDRYFARTFLLFMGILLLDLYFMEQKKNWWLIGFGAFVAAASSVLCILFFHMSKGMLLCLSGLQIVACVSMTMYQASFHRKRQAIFLFVTILSGEMLLEKVLIILQTNSRKKVLLEISYFSGIYFWMNCEKKYFMHKNKMYQVEIYIRGQKICVNALLDTGNILKEPVHQKAVYIIEKSSLCPVIVEGEEYSTVAYRSIGNTQGELQMMVADVIKIKQEEKEWICYEVYLGMYDGEISSDHSFQMLLHSDCMRKGDNNECCLENLFARVSKCMAWAKQTNRRAS